MPFDESKQWTIVGDPEGEPPGPVTSLIRGPEKRDCTRGRWISTSGGTALYGLPNAEWRGNDRGRVGYLNAILTYPQLRREQLQVSKI